MTMRFPYRRLKTNAPIPSLGGQWERPKTLVLVSLTGPGGTVAQRALLDTGADDTVFPEQLAAQVGFDLTNAPTGESAGVSGVPLPVRYAWATLRLTDGIEFREWLAWVGFVPVPMIWGLLGFAGYLQFFSANFLGDREEVELTVNSLYPGT
jgi:Aspartyl protease